MNESTGPGANLVSEAAFHEGIRAFQRFAQINETGNTATSLVPAALIRCPIVPIGLLDEETIRMMNTPRCGNADHGHSHHARRSKRYALQGKPLFPADLTTTPHALHKRAACHACHHSAHGALSYFWQRFARDSHQTSSPATRAARTRIADAIECGEAEKMIRTCAHNGRMNT